MAKNYLAEYSGNKTKKYQAGGPAPEGGAPMGSEVGAPAPEGGGGGDLQAAIMQVVQSQDPNLALQVVNMIAEAMGIAPGGAAPGGEGVPAGAMGGEMSYGYGGYIKPSYGFYAGNQGVIGGMPTGSNFEAGNQGKVGGSSGMGNQGAGNQGKVGGYGKVPMGRYGMKVPVFSASIKGEKK